MRGRLLSPYFSLQVELKVFAVDDVLHLRMKRTDQFLAVRNGSTVVIATELEVLCRKHLSLDFHQFLGERVVVIFVMNFARILDINFQNVLH